MQKKVILPICFVFGILILQLASASISITQPAQIYSLGDSLDVNVTLNPTSNSNGFLTTKIVCEDGEVEVFKMPYSGTAGKQESFYVKVKLDQNLIGDVEGLCSIKSSWNGEESETSKFEISSLVVVNIDLQGNLFEPGSKILFSGDAKLKSGAIVNGTGELSIKGNETKVPFQVVNGLFSGEMSLPSDFASGTYEVQAIVFHRDNGATLNSGKKIETFRVKQVVKAVEIALGSVSVEPGNNLEYQVVLYDQALAKASNEVEVKIKDSLGKTILEQTVNSQETQSVQISNQYLPGEWTIEAKSQNGVVSTSNFNVPEVKKINARIDNATLFIENIGNVVYDLPFEVIIGGEKETIELSLKVGGEKNFKIFAPDGNYDVSANSGEQAISFGTNWLTGKAIDVKDLSTNGLSLKTWIWSLLALILIVAVFLAYRRKMRNRNFSTDNSSILGPIKMSSIPLGSMSWKSAKPEKKEIRKLSEITMNSKMSSSAGGKKETATIIAMKVKNYDELMKYKGSEPAMNTLVQVAGIAKRAKAQVSREGNFTIMTFSPTGTQSQNCDLIAVRTAKEIESSLKSHNRKYARKISFGLGAVTGEVIVEKKDGEIKNTSLGTIIPSAKKIAEHAHEELLLSDSTRSKLRGQIKVDKGIGGIYWTVQSFVDRSSHNEFINKFMERRADESKSF